MSIEYNRCLAEALSYLTLEIHSLDILNWNYVGRRKGIKLIYVLEKIRIHQHLKIQDNLKLNCEVTPFTGCPGTAAVGSRTSLSMGFSLTFFRPKDWSRASIWKSESSSSSTATTGFLTFTLSGLIFIFSFFLVSFFSFGLKLLCNYTEFISSQ